MEKLEKSISTQIKRQLVVLKDCTSTSDGNIFVYDFPTKSWVFGDGKATASPVAGADIVADHKDRTNFITDWNGDLISMSATSELMKWSDTSNVAKNIQIFTKDIDFGASALKKKVYKVKVTYKGNADDLLFMYGVNGETDTANDLFQFNSANNPLADKSSTADMEVWHVADLKPTTSSQANNIYSIQLLASGEVGATFAIKDISIIYRTKSIK